MNLNEKIKAFLFDIDGTLINRQCVMSDSLKGALRTLKAKGYHLSINSGRPPRSSEMVLIQNDCADLFEYYFGSNGIEVFNVATRENTYVAQLDPEVLKDIDGFFQDDYLALAMYDENGDLLFNHFPRSDKHIKEWCALRYAKPILYDYKTNERSFPKAIALFEVERKEDFMEKIKGFKHEAIDNFMSGTDVMEIVPKGLNKGRSVHEYAKMLNIDPKEILCVGDAQSDLPALFNGTGLFVGDALADGKDDVEYHCPSVHEDGVTVFLRDNHFLD